MAAPHSRRLLLTMAADRAERGLRFVEIEQNTAEWFGARLGADRANITASSVRDIENIPRLAALRWYRGLGGFVRRRLAAAAAAAPPPAWDPGMYPAAHGQYYEAHAVRAFRRLWGDLCAGRDPAGGGAGVTRHMRALSPAAARAHAAAADGDAWGAGGLWRSAEWPWLLASPDRVLDAPGAGFHLLEVKCPTTPAALSTPVAVDRYFAQVQVQLLVTGAESAFLFIYHVATRRVTLIRVFPLRTAVLRDRAIPVLERVHAALADATRRTPLDYAASFVIAPRRGEWSYVPYVENAHAPGLFDAHAPRAAAGEGAAAGTEARVVEHWLALPTMGERAGGAGRAPPPTTAACARAGCAVRGAYVRGADGRLYCSLSCARRA